MRILICVVPAMLLPSVASLFYFIVLPGRPSGWLIYTTTKSFTLLWPLVAMWTIEKEHLSLGQSNILRHIQAIPMGALSGFAIAALVIGLYESSPFGEYVRVYREAVRRKVETLGLLRYYAFYSAFLALFHSLLEEYFWRWYVFGRLSRIVHPTVAYGLSSLAFAGHHYVVLSCYFPLFGTVLFGTCVGIGGGFWCWLYQRQNSLVGVWVSHLLVDVAIVHIGHELIFL